jgi:hypothetical protein
LIRLHDDVVKRGELAVVGIRERRRRKSGECRRRKAGGSRETEVHERKRSASRGRT